METDHALFELVSLNPDWVEELTGQNLPPFASAESKTFKKIKVECDVHLTPVVPDDDHYIVEFQMYHDHSVFIRTDQARAALWRKLNDPDDCLLKKYRPVDVRGIVIFGGRSHIPKDKQHHPKVQYFLIQDLYDSLKKRHPNSPLLPVLAPLVEKAKDLEKTA